jgi:alkylphosphonate utilization operon protein PhnA
MTVKEVINVNNQKKKYIDFCRQITNIYSITVKDCNETPLNDGDSVTIIIDLKVKGTSSTLKQGTLLKGIKRTNN